MPRNPVEKPPTSPEGISRLSLRVTDAELQNVQYERETIKSLRRRLAEAEKVLAQDEHDIMTKLRRGARIASTRFDATIVPTTLPRRPEYKELFLDHMERVHARDRAAFLNELQEAVTGRPGPPKLVVVMKPKLEKMH